MADCFQVRIARSSGTNTAASGTGRKILVKPAVARTIKPALAESWTYSRDCLELTFKLRRDVKWHDGRPFTADDVVFTYQTMINPKTPAPFKEGFLLVKAVNRMKRDAPPAPAAPTPTEALLAEIRDLLKRSASSMPAR